MGVKQIENQDATLSVKHSPLYKYWEAIYLSFFSKELYVDVSKRWKGFGFLYLLMLVAILCIPFAIKGVQNFNQYFEEELVSPLRQLPTLYIRNGEVSLDHPVPYFVKNKEGKPVVMIDTRKDINSFPTEYPSLNFLITKNKMFFRTPDPAKFFNETPTTSYANNKNIYVQNIDTEDNEVFSGKQWVDNTGILKIKLLGQFLIYPTMLFGFFGRLVVLLLVFALLGQLVSKYFYSTKLTFKESSRILAVALTPTMAAVILVFILNISSSWLSLLYVITLTAYFSFACIAIREDRSKVVPL